MSIGISRPITPVEQIAISSAGIFKSLETKLTNSSQSSIPFWPVKQFAFPLFTTTAETETYKWVQLPNDFKGKNFRAYATLSDTWEGSWEWGEPWVVQRMVVFVADYDRANARVAIQGYRTDKNYKTVAHRHKPVAGMLIVIA